MHKIKKIRRKNIDDNYQRRTDTKTSCKWKERDT